MVEGARLESVYTATYRGFESLTLRHIKKAPKGAFLIWLQREGEEKPRGFDKFAGSEFGQRAALAPKAGVSRP